MKTKLITLVFALFLFGSCASLWNMESNFTANKVKLGMPKTYFLTKFGNPYKQNFFYNEANEYCEVLFYREQVFTGNSWIEMDTIFTFVNGKLESQQQVEVPKYRHLEKEHHHSHYQKHSTH